MTNGVKEYIMLLNNNALHASRVTKVGGYLTSSSFGEQLLELKKDHVLEFLTKLNQPGVQFSFEREDERRNRDTMVALSIMTPIEVYDIIKSLEYTDYSSGPEVNKSSNAPKFFQDGDVWIFGKNVEGLDSVTLEVYIKVCFKEHNGRGFTACISFHEAEFQMVYPFKSI